MTEGNYDPFYFGGAGKPDNSTDFLIDKEYLKVFVAECQKDRVNPPSQRVAALVKDGDRVADEFRKLFPEVSDKDLGTLIIVFVQVLTMVAETRAMNLASILQKMCGTYAYAGSNIIKGVLDIDGLNDQ